MKPKKFLTQKKIDKLQALIDDNNGVVNHEDILPLLKGFKKQLLIQLVSIPLYYKQCERGRDEPCGCTTICKITDADI